MAEIRHFENRHIIRCGTIITCARSRVNIYIVIHDDDDDDDVYFKIVLNVFKTRPVG